MNPAHLSRTPPAAPAPPERITDLWREIMKEEIPWRKIMCPGPSNEIGSFYVAMATAVIFIIQNT